RQVVRPAVPFEMPIVDLGRLPAHRRSAEVDAYAAAEAARPFDLKRDTLLRSSLLRVEAERHVLLLTLHHIASDGWSQTVLWQEIGAFYAEAVAGPRPGSGDPQGDQKAVPPTLPVQYADFAEWQ